MSAVAIEIERPPEGQTAGEPFGNRSRAARSLPMIENRLPHLAPLFSSRARTARPSMPGKHTAIYAHCEKL
jgi:hypothetical protein